MAKTTRTTEEFVADLKRFIDGTADHLDFDDFVTFELSDVRLEALRKEALDVILDNPVGGLVPWLSPQGNRKLLAVLHRA